MHDMVLLHCTGLLSFSSAKHSFYFGNKHKYPGLALDNSVYYTVSATAIATALCNKSHDLVDHLGSNSDISSTQYYNISQTEGTIDAIKNCISFHLQCKL